MKRVKVIRQTAEWYDVPDEVTNAMEELQKFVLEQNAKITSLMGISVSMITDIPNDVIITTEVTAEDTTEVVPAKPAKKQRKKKVKTNQVS